MNPDEKLIADRLCFDPKAFASISYDIIYTLDPQFRMVMLTKGKVSVHYPNVKGFSFREALIGLIPSVRLGYMRQEEKFSLDDCERVLNFETRDISMEPIK